MGYARGGCCLGLFARGDIVITLFPFADLTGSKIRPALVVTTMSGGDLLLCMITSQVHSDGYSIPLRAADFLAGGLRVVSYARTNRLFTTDPVLVLKGIGTLKPTKMQAITDRIVEIVTQ
jgi:mRNA interferase MazF